MSAELPLTGALREAAGAGPFFGVRLGPAPSGDPRTEGYLPLLELYGPIAASGLMAEAAAREDRAGRLPADAATPALRARIDTVAAGLGTAEPRVAASLAYQGLAARLWSLGLGPAALHGQVPDLRPDGLWWNPDRGAPDDLWLPAPEPPPGGGPGDPDAVAGRLFGTVLVTHLLPLLRATRAAGRISEALLWGNAASALAGTARVLHQWCRATGRREAADRGLDLTRILLARPPLRQAGGWRLGPERDFRRHSCCLYYRVPGGGLCGDCALHRRPG
ncbi:hypothetical protein ACZ90_41675 [Streptomyces albus subsp. albus]|nr:hypothetical protein ACZ90_41675 [Streptomyces albus subsp. albus]